MEGIKKRWRGGAGGDTGFGVGGAGGVWAAGAGGDGGLSDWGVGLDWSWRPGRRMVGRHRDWVVRVVVADGPVMVGWWCGWGGRLLVVMGDGGGVATGLGGGDGDGGGGVTPV